MTQDLTYDGSPLTTNVFVFRVQKVLASAGLDAELYSGLSFAYELGLALRTLQLERLASGPVQHFKYIFRHQGSSSWHNYQMPLVIQLPRSLSVHSCTSVHVFITNTIVMIIMWCLVSQFVILFNKFIVIG